MNNVILKFYASVYIAVCIFYSSGTANPAPLLLQSNQGDDSVTIVGKFIYPCYIPEKVKVWKYNIWETYYKGDDVLVNRDGVFSYRVAVKGTEQLSIKYRQDQMPLDFIVNSNEKTYTIEITCGNNRAAKSQAPAEVKGSYENQAFSELKAFSNVVTDSLDSLLGKPGFDMADKKAFAKVRKLFWDYQQEVSSIVKNYPGSYTAKVLCPAEILPDSVFSSIRALRDNFLRREALTNRQLYNTNFLTFHILANYFLLIDNNDTSFTGFGKALDIVCKNTETAKIIEQIFYGSLFYQHRETLLRGYINWANHNSDKMLNLVVKTQLANLSKCIAGAPYIDIALNDPHGVPRKLSETVAGAKLTLLIFYSPTCEHCQRELPRLVPLWNQFKNKGFKIYAEGYDATNEEWLNFMKEKGTSEWTNVFADDAGAASGGKYMLTGSPTFILINEQGIIITRFANADNLLEEIPKYFNQ